MYFDRLEKNLIDIIKEEQAKLGFRKEAIRLYYPLSSLNHFFEAEDSEAEMLARLSGFPASLTKKLGNVTVTAKKDRFCFHIPEDGSVYVHEHTDANEFIRSLVELLQHHGCTMDDIFSLFKDTSENVIFDFPFGRLFLKMSDSSVSKSYFPHSIETPDTYSSNFTFDLLLNFLSVSIVELT